MNYQRSFNHVGLTVPDIYAALDWYVEVLGFVHLMGPRVLSAGDKNDTRAAIIMGPQFKKAYQAQLLSANGVGLELFQYVDPVVERYAPDQNMRYWEQGYWHICYTDPNIEEVLARIVTTGGRQRSPIFQMVPNLPYRLAYAEDPFGNVLEICTHSYAEAWSHWPQRGMTWDIPVLYRDGSEGPLTDEFLRQTGSRPLPALDPSGEPR